MTKKNIHNDFADQWLSLSEKNMVLSHWEFLIKQQQFQCSSDFFKTLGYRPYKLDHGWNVEFKGQFKEDKLVFTNQLKKLSKSERKSSVLFRLKDKKGNVYHLKSIGKLVKNSNGTPLKIAGVFLDQTVTEQHKEIQSETLKFNEQLFKSLVQDGSDLIGILDSEGNYIYVSPTSKTILGIDAEEFIGKNAFNFIHPDDVDTVLFQFGKLAIEKRIEITPFRFRNHKGEWRWIETVATNLINDTYIGGIVANSRDVTDKVIVQKTDLLERELMSGSIKEEQSLENLLTNYFIGLENLFGGMKTCLLKISDDTMTTYLAPSLSKSYQSKFEGKKISPDSGSCGAAAFSKNVVIVEDIKKDPLWQKKAEFAIREGLKSCWSAPILNSKGKVVAIFLHYYDTTRRPDPLELELFQRSASLIGLIIESYNKSKSISLSNERYELINEVTRDAIYEWDVVNDIFYWSETFYRLFNYPKTDNVFRLEDWSSLMHPIDREINNIPWQEFLKDHTKHQWIKEFRFKSGINRYIYVEESGRLIRDANGNPIRMIGVLRDISTNRKFEAQKELEYVISQSFKTDENLDQILKSILTYLVRFGSFKTGEIWLSDSKTELIKLRSYVSADELSGQYFKYPDHRIQLKKGEGLPGVVLEKSSVEIWQNLQSNRDFLRRKAAAAAGLNTGFGIPILANNAPIGVLMFCSSNEISEEVVDWFKSIGTALGAELRRKQQEEEMQILFESAPEILAIVSPDGCFTKVNKAFCDLMIMTSDNLVSQPFLKFVHPDDLEDTLTVFDNSVSGTSRAKKFTNRYKNSRGDYKWISWTSSDLFGEDGFTFVYGRDVTEIKKIEKLLEDATNMARVGAWEVDLVRNELYWSPMTKEIHEVPADFIPNMDIGFGFCKEGPSRDMMENLIYESVNAGKSWDVEFPIITAKGRECWIRAIGELEFENNKCVKIFGSLQDIDRQKKAEFQLHKLVVERDNILERISDAFFAVDTNWIVTYWNREAERMLGTRKHEIIGKYFWDVYNDAAGIKFYAEYKRAVSTGEAVCFEEYYSPTNMWVEVNAYPSATGLSVFFRDITLRHVANEEIRLAHERFDNVTRATNDAIWDWDIVKGTIYRGEGFLKLFGQETVQEERTLNSWVERIHPEDINEVRSSLADFIKTTEATNWQHEYRYLKSDQKYANVKDRGIVIRDGLGAAVRMVGAITDVTYQKEHEKSLHLINEKVTKYAKDLEMSNRELEQFAYVASHDLQEPLRMVTSFLTQLSDKYSDALDDKAQKYINFAVDGAIRMKQIIYDLLEYSRLRKFEAPIENINLNKLIKDVCHLQQKLIDEKNAEIIVADFPVIKSFKSPMSQVFQNLIGNALKYSRKDLAPKIEINYSENETEWIFSVSDNGIGIDPEFHEKIFILFQRLHSKDEFSGTGLGLAIVKKIIENMKGEIWLESTVGEGSTFFFKLPK